MLKQLPDSALRQAQNDPVRLGLLEQAQDDPILLAFHEGNYLYSLRGPMSPGSIRDQIVRGCMLVDNLVAWQILPASKTPPALPDYSSLAVLGAGAAGMTVALRAAAQGVQVTLFDCDPGYHNVEKIPQLGCGFRYISPTMYDWPMAHFTEPKIPWANGGKLPLPFANGIANNVAELWEAMLTSENVRLGSFFSEDSGVNVDVYRDASGTPLPNLIGELNIVEAGTTNSHGEFKVVIDCRGGAKEDVNLPIHNRSGRSGQEVGHLHGFPFWGWRDRGNPTSADKDAIEDMDFGVGVASKANIAICGSGDGALQDFARAVFHPRFHLDDVYQSMLSHPDVTQPLTVFADQVNSAERQAQRSLKWLHTSLNHSNKILNDLHSSYTSALTELLLDSDVRDPMYSMLDFFARHNLSSTLHLIHTKSFFGNCYPLNRFFVLLLERYLSYKNFDVRIISNTRVTYAVALGNLALQSKNPTDYLGVPYELYDSSHQLIGVYNVVVPRKGVEKRGTNAPAFVPFRTRQIFPYQMPYDV